MSFSGLVLTNSGKGELVKCGLGQPFQITDIVFGSGQYNGTGTNIKELVNQVMSLPATSVERDSQNEDVVRVECDFNSTDVPRPFFWREIGIIANGKLCYYDNSRDDAEYIDPESETIVKQKRMRFLLMISSEVNVSPVIGSSLYAEKKEVQEVLYPNFAEATERENIASGEKISILFGKIRKWFSDLKAVAFSGSYNDLSDKPSIPTAVAVKGNAESLYRTGDVNLTPANIGALPSSYVVYGNTTTVAGYALDARQANPNIAGSLGAQIKAANTALTAHKTSGDHDGRYYTETEIKQLFNSFLSVATKQSSDYTLNPGGTATMTVSCAVSGYTPIGIIGFNCSGTSESYCNIYRCILSGTTCTMQIKNMHQSNEAVVKANFHVLYRKNM